MAIGVCESGFGGHVGFSILHYLYTDLVMRPLVDGPAVLLYTIFYQNMPNDQIMQLFLHTHV